MSSLQHGHWLATRRQRISRAVRAASVITDPRAELARRRPVEPYRVRYEEVVADPAGVTRGILEFLGIHRPPGDLERLDHTVLWTDPGGSFGAASVSGE